MIDEGSLADAIARAGRSEPLRNALLEVLRRAEEQADDPALFRKQVRRPLVLSLLRAVTNHQVTLANGLLFEVGLDSLIEQALLLSREARPDHIWEPQTTRLLLLLSQGAANVILGGAYIGDQVLPLAHALSKQQPSGLVHAFEPADEARQKLCRNLELNGIRNVVVHGLGLWSESNLVLTVLGRAPLASSGPVDPHEVASKPTFKSITIDEYVRNSELASVSLLMLDTEGGEERALHGARELLGQPRGSAPNIVFEIHRQFIDWSDGLENTAIVRFLANRGYRVFAIRDFQDNYSMVGHPIEIIPIDQVYLAGPPHGFNLMATKDGDLIARLGLRIVENVSPKLLLHKDPTLHSPLS